MTTACTMTDYITFWRNMSDCMNVGKTLLTALDQTGAKLTGTQLEPVVKAMRTDVAAGSTLSSAMKRHEQVFPRIIRTMMLAGEVAGAMNVAASRVAHGLIDGTLAMPGMAPAENEQVSYWATFGMLLSTGVPVLETINLLCEGTQDARLLESTKAIHKAIMEGKTISSAMAGYPDVFASEVCAAVDLGERTGQLDAQSLRIAEALKLGNLSLLLPPSMPATSAAEKEEPVVVRAFNDLIARAVREQASDIHFDPAGDGRGRIRLRIDGVLRDIEPLPEGIFPQIITRVKILCGLETAEHRQPQDGVIMMDAGGTSVDLRLNIVPTIAGERLVLRLLDRQHAPLALNEIGLEGEDLAKIKRLCTLPNGIVIANGKTGSGKTTLLYAMLMEIDRDAAAVITVEDPVEYRLPGVAQMEVKPQAGLTYPRLIRSMLRQDPDVIMVGEIRDLETMTLVAQSAVTGHLLFTTLHASTSPGAIVRLLDMGIEPFMVNSSLAAVISQDLVRMLCPDCRKPSKPALHSLPPRAVEFVKSRGDATFYEPAGCGRCHGTGYRGRTAIHEILIMDDRIRQAVADSKDVSAIRDAAIASGMKTMLESGLEKAARGITSIAEVLRTVPFGPNV